MEEIAMARMSLEKAKHAHFKARKRILEQQIEKASEKGDAMSFIELSRELDLVEFRIEVAQSYLNEGFHTKARNTVSVASSVGNYTPLPCRY